MLQNIEGWFRRGWKHSNNTGHLIPIIENLTIPKFYQWEPTHFLVEVISGKIFLHLMLKGSPELTFFNPCIFLLCIIFPALFPRINRSPPKMLMAKTALHKTVHQIQLTTVNGEFLFQIMYLCEREVVAEDREEKKTTIKLYIFQEPDTLIVAASVA